MDIDKCKTINETHLRHLLASKQVIYAGFDPTASSLHIGHIIPLLALNKLCSDGHDIIIVIGDATAIIGDPTGRNRGRNQITEDEVKHNSKQISEQILKIVSNASIVHNRSWIDKLSFLEYLGEFGVHFNVNTMLGKSSVKSRIDSKNGMPLSEFTYSTIQAIDFYSLNKMFGCTIQVGGEDQLGNIVAGTNLISRKTSIKVCAILTPLLTDSKGEKIGKSNGTPIWLDPSKTSVSDFHRFWFNTSDGKLRKNLGLVTDYSDSDIADILNEHYSDTSLMHGQKMLADRATYIVHGTTKLNEDMVCSNRTVGEVIDVAELFVECGLTESKSKARKLIISKGAYLNGERVIDQFEKYKVKKSGEMISLRRGKNRTVVLNITNGKQLEI